MSDLIERLRNTRPDIDADPIIVLLLLHEAADALEAKDQRIAELETAINMALQGFDAGESKRDVANGLLAALNGEQEDG